jgi:hypothetical protein
MSQVATPHPESGEPSRYRRVSAALAYALFAAPAIWLLVSSVGYGVASEACYPGDTPLLRPAFGPVNAIGLGLLLVTVTVSLAGVVVAWRIWARTREEHRGNHEHLMEIGEGRTRFLALCGLLASALFALATLFELSALLILPPCV